MEQEVDRAVDALADRLAGEVEPLTPRMTEHLLREIPPLAEDPVLRAELEDTVSASVTGWLEVLKSGRPAAEIAPPGDVLAIARSWVLRGAPLPTLLRAFHVGHGFVIRDVLSGIPEPERESELFGPLVERLLAVSFAYVDALTVHVAEVYAKERARLARSADAARSEAARKIVAGEPVDVDAASRSLGYELRRWHVGLLVWGDQEDETEDPISRLEAAAGEIAAGLGSARPVLVPAGRSQLWAWCGLEAPPEAEDLSALTSRPLQANRAGAAVGEPGHGADGFARSHAEALEARRVALLTGREHAVTLYSDVELLSLLTADPDRARRFAQAELGELAGRDDVTLRLRATLRVYLDEGCSYAAAARRLGIHEKTVRYRVRQCEEALARPVGGQAQKLAAALLLAETLDSGD